VELKAKLPNHNVISVKELTDLAELCEKHPKKDKFIEALLTYSEENNPDDELLCGHLKCEQILEKLVMTSTPSKESTNQEVNIKAFDDHLVKNMESGVQACCHFVPDGDKLTVQQCDEATFLAQSGMKDNGMDLIILEDSDDLLKNLKMRLTHMEKHMKNYLGAVLALQIPDSVEIDPKIFAIDTNGKPLSIITNQIFPGYDLDHMFDDDEDMKKRWEHVHFACGTGLEYMQKWLSILEGEWKNKTFLALTTEIEEELKLLNDAFKCCHKITNNDLKNGTYAGNLPVMYGRSKTYNTSFPVKELLNEHIMPSYAFLHSDPDRITNDFILQMLTKQKFYFYGTLGIQHLRIWLYCHGDIQEKIDYMSKDCFVIFYEEGTDLVHAIFTAIKLSDKELEKIKIFEQCTPRIPNLKQKLADTEWEDPRDIVGDLEDSKEEVLPATRRGSDVHYRFNICDPRLLERICKNRQRRHELKEPNEFGRTMSMRLVTYHTNEKIGDKVNMNPYIDQKRIERFAKIFYKSTDTQKQLTDQKVYLGNDIVFSSMAEFKDHKLLQPFVNGPASEILMQNPPDVPSEIQQDVSNHPQESLDGGGSESTPSAGRTPPNPAGDSNAGERDRRNRCVIL